MKRKLNIIVGEIINATQYASATSVTNYRLRQICLERQNNILFVKLSRWSSDGELCVSGEYCGRNNGVLQRRALSAPT